MNDYDPSRFRVIVEPTGVIGGYAYSWVLQEYRGEYEGWKEISTRQYGVDSSGYSDFYFWAVRKGKRRLKELRATLDKHDIAKKNAAIITMDEL